MGEDHSQLPVSLPIHKHIILGSVGGGIWKTEDGGMIWENVSDGYFNTGSVGAVAVSESDPNVVYVGMGEACIRPVMTSHGDGVYKSTDAGETWIHIGLKDTRTISSVLVHPKDHNTVLCSRSRRSISGQ